MTFDLPMPPSVNACFATDFKTKRRFASKAYTTWKKVAGQALASQYAAYGSPSVHKPVALTIRLGLNYQSDIANREKPLTDLLVANLDMADDRYIERIVIERDQTIEGAVVTIQGSYAGEARPVGVIAKSIIENAILNTPDAADRKERVLVAREAGILTDQEAQDWIALLEVKSA